MAELADAQDLKSCCSDTVPVRFRSPALRRAHPKGEPFLMPRRTEYGRMRMHSSLELAGKFHAVAGIKGEWNIGLVNFMLCYYNK